jgi:exopolysaccharide biosynthesis predicted pyruvyltransferase EpsI
MGLSPAIAMTQDDQAVLNGLRDQTLDTLRGCIGDMDEPMALLDFPNHNNFGDTLIWQGTRNYLAELGADVAYTTDMFRFDASQMAKSAPRGPILMHGGGNFGDIWPWYQAFREQIVTAHQDRKIVQLSQSIWFDDEAAAARCNAIMGSHPDYTLLVREQESLERSRRQLPDVRAVYCPDLALGVTPRGPATPRPFDVVMIARDDREAKVSLRTMSVPGRVDVGDWRMAKRDTLAWRALSLPGSAYYRLRGQGKQVAYPLVARSYELLAATNTRAATGQLGAGRVVLTDRLHAQVLATLMGLPSVALDNSYGKISSIHRAYTGSFSTARLATGIDEARELVAELLA